MVLFERTDFHVASDYGQELFDQDYPSSDPTYYYDSEVGTKVFTFSICQHTSASGCIRQHTSQLLRFRSRHEGLHLQHTSAYVSIRLHPAAYVPITTIPK
jgi:hypothetical protein